MYPYLLIIPSTPQYSYAAYKCTNQAVHINLLMHFGKVRQKAAGKYHAHSNRYGCVKLCTFFLHQCFQQGRNSRPHPPAQINKRCKE